MQKYILKKKKKKIQLVQMYTVLKLCLFWIHQKAGTVGKYGWVLGRRDPLA